MCSQQESRFIEVLPLVIQHCPDLSCAEHLCSLLQVSSNCRRQLQQSRGHMNLCWPGSLNFEAKEEEDWLLRVWERLRELGRWLVQHAGLVSGLTLLECPYLSTRELQLVEETWADMLRWCWTSAARSNAKAAAVGIAAWGGAASGTAPAAAPQLQLQSVLLHFFPGPMLLQELAAAGLQELKFRVLRWSDPTMAACNSSLSCLQPLRKLALSSIYEMPLDIQAAVQHLTQLTELQGALLTPSTVQQLPHSLQTLSCFFQADGDGCCRFDLDHLTALNSLKWQVPYYARSQGHSAQLPQSLTGLTVWGGLQSFTGGQGLQHVALRDAVALLQPLSGLTRPWGLMLQLWQWEATAGTAAAIFAAKQLTRIELDVQRNTVAAALGTEQWCGQLANLRNLRVLILHRPLMWQDMRRQNLLQLSGLTSLHVLHLNNCFPFHYDLFAAAFPPAPVPGRHALALNGSRAQHRCVLPLLAALTGLQALSFRGDYRCTVGDAQLMALSMLTQLNSPCLYPKGWTTEGEARFLQGMPHLRQISTTAY